MSIIEVYSEIDDLKEYIDATLKGESKSIDIFTVEKIRNIYRTIVPGFKGEDIDTCEICCNMYLIGLHTYHHQHLTEYKIELEKSQPVK